MEVPKPTPALVISYAYLWAEEAAKGQEEGQKNRPCAVILTLVTERTGTRVAILPITHTPPRDPRLAYKLPPPVKAHLGLDDGESWVVLTEYNIFVWPGPDLRPVSPQNTGNCVYGLLPDAVFRSIKAKFEALEAAARITVVPRPE